MIERLRSEGNVPIKPGKEEVIRYLKTGDEAEITELFRKADETRKRYVGDEVHLRGIIEFSNYCTRDCLYCGLRRSNAVRFRYRMSIDEIFSAAREARELGFMTVVLQSGEDRSYKTADICALVSRIKKELDLAITLSIGELPRDDYRKLREAGADRYLIRFETSDPGLFRELKPDSGHAERMEILSWLRELGFQVGSGIMIGLPGQTFESVADDILLFDRLKLDMIGSGPFIANPETPLGDSPGGDITMALKLVALTRLVTLDSHIPATTALGSLDPDGRRKALECGANVIMPNVTPRKYRKHYLLYPGKICTDDSPQDCRGCMEAMLASMGRTISTGYGHSLKRELRGES